MGARPSLDVFALGRVFFFVATRKKPFEVEGRSAREQIMSGRVVQLRWPSLTKILAESGVQEIAEKCMNEDAAVRPTIAKIQDCLVERSEKSRDEQRRRKELVLIL